MRKFNNFLTHVFCISAVFCCSIAVANSLEIPKISEPLKISDFTGMRPRPGLEAKLAKVEGFLQSNPNDGTPSTQKTVVYIAYDQENVYIVFLCFDSDAKKIRASMTRRERFSDDEDWVEVYFDTYSDRRRAYDFSTNALGVQWDARYSEATGGSSDDFSGFQPSFDALWYSDGRLTDEGYIVWMAIPFKSIRFPSGPQQNWRMLFGRSIPRSNEYVAWPHVSKQIQGVLTQSSTVTGLRNVSPGKNLQFIPYTSFRSFRFLDTEQTPPRTIKDKSDPAAGIDSKFIVKDSSVVDFTFNPDFSQVESDQPQVTVNQRFEVFFPERRPFFLENAQYFETPLDLVFTRRIADPQYGGRFTGKLGGYTLGFLFSDDQAPGKIAPENSNLAGKDAHFGIFRFARDIFTQSYVGVLATTRSFAGSTNTVVGGDLRLRLNDQWQLTGQAVASRTSDPASASFSGRAYSARIARTGRQFKYEASYNDFSPEFRTLTGFIPRTDYRVAETLTSYYFRPKDNAVIAWGPEFAASQSWDYAGTRLDSSVGPGIYFELPRRTMFRAEYYANRERIRPSDFPILQNNVDFDTSNWKLWGSSSFWNRGTLELQIQKGKDVNFFPAGNVAPYGADLTELSASLILRALRNLQFRNNYFFTALATTSGETIFNDHIIRTNANYQFSRNLSLRIILQYEGTITNAQLTTLENRRNLNADLLVTYLVNPWTALYVGYNGNRQNWQWIEEAEGRELIRSNGHLMNDANQFFLKFSYLFRF